MSNEDAISAPSIEPRYIVAHPGSFVESTSMEQALIRGGVFAADSPCIVYEIREVGRIDPPARPRIA